ncbi:lectin BRA-3, partial [Biomphalaria pfeifferi]
MHSLHLTIPLFLFATYLALIAQLADCQFCKSGTMYHRLSHICMAVVDELKTHENADTHCADVFSGGHLVHIFDAETNVFITTNLLLDIAWYHIGLNDAGKNGVYRWSDGQIATYTNFHAIHTPNVTNIYVKMSKYSWHEDYNSESKFICQTPAERNVFFFLNDSVFDNNTLETTALARNIWNCGIQDKEDHHLELLYRNIDGTMLNLYHDFGKDLSHVMFPGCNSSGVYFCRITHELKYVLLDGILKVRCKATYCDEEANPNLLSPVNTGHTEGKLCVFVYPRPTSVYVFKERTHQSVDRSKYNITFIYTDETSTRGEFYMRFYNVTSSDYGTYF